MRVDRPAPGEEINDGDPTPPRLAASVIVLRDGERGPEVLLVKRNPAIRFMGGAWVFPGGAVDRGEDDPRRAGVRELEEEASLTVAEDSLVAFSRWITPREVKIRFDTWFFVAPAPDGAEPVADGDECVDLCWIRAEDALAAGERGELMLVFPTIKHLEQLCGFGSVAEIVEEASGREVRPVEPRISVDGDGGRVVLPGEPGYEEVA